MSPLGGLGFAIGFGATIIALKNFYEGYYESKQISTDPINPTNVDSFTGENCQGYNLSVPTGTGYYDTYYYYGEVSFGGHTASNLRINSIASGAYYTIDGREVTAIWEGAGNVHTVGFVVYRYNATLYCSLGYQSTEGGRVRGVSSDIIRVENICTNPIQVSQSTKASIDLDTWNANIDWLDELVESGSTGGISIDSDSYTEVTDPDELADTIMDAITDNDYEGTLAEIPEPINYATTVKKALDDLDTKVIDTSPVDVISTIPESESSTGTPGQIAYNSNYIYVCVATDTWKRAALGSW